VFTFSSAQVKLSPGMLDCGAREIDAGAMRLMLLRHAKSEKAEGGMSDHVRRLSARGKADAPVIGAYMARHALIPDLVLVSTAERTRQTWERVATALTTPPRVAYEERLYNAGAEAIIALVKGTAAMVRTLLVVGHNPGLHEAARRLIASGDVETRERLNEGLPTSGLAVIDFAGKDWRKLHPRGGRLERFVSPRSLAEADRV
jgi:phosphohistidine phosphatase